MEILVEIKPLFVFTSSSVNTVTFSCVTLELDTITVKLVEFELELLIALSKAYVTL